MIVNSEGLGIQASMDTDRFFSCFWNTVYNAKSALVHESKIFNDKQLKEKKCIDLLNKCIFLLNQGQTFADQEKSSLFFNATKLFQIPQSQRNKLY